MNAQNPVKKEGTVLFCDIRNFTFLFDQRDPFEAVEFANNVLAVLGEVVENHQGVVDRFTGDGFMAHFGFDKLLPDHPEKACKTAIAIRKKLNEINTKRYLNVETVLAAGLGLHTGEAAYCKIETNQLEQTTVLGDTVNTAARIEELTKHFVVDVLVSEASYQLLKENFKFQKMPEREIKGKDHPISTYWLLPINL
ncbi:adenylate/guanylate cyclase domain-containing protein [Gracilimonas mengyeensis]|uniref:Adenylate cyclase, class 3 n=1 Tax=Gracilimonas mengyeensis TaxID=1302730 RepID=A0A521FAX7_9BACT|nr:adenylate/guanylate cyclase domain-containing protein [Gracilimonas mengyeensis]SMO93313.1 Adenylate cyclase, class 3 [Gracilimonas mengyeensis]